MKAKKPMWPLGGILAQAEPAGDIPGVKSGYRRNVKAYKISLRLAAEKLHL